MKLVRNKYFFGLQRSGFYSAPILILFSLFLARGVTVCQTSVTPTNVLVGDAVQIGQIGYSSSTGCQPVSVTFTHNQGSDFTLLTPRYSQYPYYILSGGYLV